MSTRMNLYASLAVPFITLLSIGISYTNKVEGITKAIVGAVVFFSIFFGSLQWCVRRSGTGPAAGAACGFLPLAYAPFYIAAYVLIVIAMVVFRK